MDTGSASRCRFPHRRPKRRRSPPREPGRGAGNLRRPGGRPGETGCWPWSQVAPPSVAVLPFDDLSPEADSRYFADGIHEAIITKLAGVKAMKVISRTSVMEYRGRTGNIRGIGEALGVANIVEGSVQRVGDRVRVSAQLIRVADDRHLWAESYDGHAADVFAIQAELAKRVVDSVRSTLTPGEAERLERPPTSSPEAYDYYLRGIAYEREARFDRPRILGGGSLLERAVALDPQFALAHAALARVHFNLYSPAREPSLDRLEQGRASAEAALRLQPDLPEGHLALARYHQVRHYQVAHTGFAPASAEIAAVLEHQPNNSEAIFMHSINTAKQGRWDEALDLMQRSIELTPRDAENVGQLAWLYLLARRFADAAAAWDRSIEIAPHVMRFKLRRAAVDFLASGDLTAWQRVLDDAPPELDPEVVAEWRRALMDLTHDYAQALRLSAARPDQAGSEHLSLGDLATVNGLAAEARRHYLDAKAHAERYVAQFPDVIWGHIVLGESLASLGDRDRALQEAALVTKLLPESADAVWGYNAAVAVARMHARAGDPETALAQLAELLRRPGNLFIHDIRRDVAYHALWKHPGFAAFSAKFPPEPAGLHGRRAVKG
jgi:TolB-like protein/tetratricopeptide (TPR) repeat protein